MIKYSGAVTSQLFEVVLCALSTVLSVFAHEVGKELETRLVEVSFASALSIVTDNGHHVDSNNSLLQSQLLEYSGKGDDCMWAPTSFNKSTADCVDSI